MKIKSMYSVVMLTALTGCGLMEVGKTQSVSFSSNIDETTIFDRDGQVVCATPCEICILSPKRRATSIVRFS